LVVVRDYDRLWRTDALRAQVTALCRQHHVQVFSCNQPVEPVAAELLASTDTARLSEVIFGWMSEQENLTRARRAKSGMEGRIARRGLSHTPRVPYGYRRGPTPDYPLEVYEPEAVHVRWMFERRAEGWGFHRIGDALGAHGVRPHGSERWLISTLSGMLRNETYMGVAHWGGARNANGQHPAIVDADLFARVQAVDAHHTMLFRPGGSVRLLTGLVKCGHCGWGASYVPEFGGRYLYLRCARRALQRDLCVLGNWRAGAVEEHVLGAVKAALASPAEWEAARRAEYADGDGHNAARLASLDAALGDAQTRLKRWDTLYESGGISANELLLHRQEIRGQVDAVAAEREQLVESARAIESGVTQLTALAGVLREIDAMDTEGRRQLIRLLVARVRLLETPERHIEIDWL
jgi:hypothetical protein